MFVCDVEREHLQLQDRFYMVTRADTNGEWYADRGGGVKASVYGAHGYDENICTWHGCPQSARRAMLVYWRWAEWAQVLRVGEQTHGFTAACSSVAVLCGQVMSAHTFTAEATKKNR